jgi:hypothetical protein
MERTGIGSFPFILLHSSNIFGRFCYFLLFIFTYLIFSVSIESQLLALPVSCLLQSQAEDAKFRDQEGHTYVNLPIIRVRCYWYIKLVGLSVK